jgi:hypothetical protein
LKNFAIWRNFAQNKTLLERGAEEDLTSRPVFLGFHLSGFHSPKLLLLISSGSERAFVCRRFAVATIEAQFSLFLSSPAVASSSWYVFNPLLLLCFFLARCFRCTLAFYFEQELDLLNRERGEG